MTRKSDKAQETVQTVTIRRRVDKSEENNGETAESAPEVAVPAVKHSPAVSDKNTFGIPDVMPVYGSIRAHLLNKQPAPGEDKSTASRYKNVYINPKGAPPVVLKTTPPPASPSKKEYHRPVKPLPLPILAFRQNGVSRFEITQQEIREQLELDADTVFCPVLVSGKVTKDFWFACSALCNDKGGLIIVGLHRRDDGSYIVKGVENAVDTARDMLKKCRDRRIVSEALFTVNDIKIRKLNRRYVLCIAINKENLSGRPVYLGDDSFSKKFRQGTYVLEGSGFRKATADEVKALWSRWLGKWHADWQQEGKIIEHFQDMYRSRHVSGEKLHSGLGLALRKEFESAAENRLKLKGLKHEKNQKKAQKDPPTAEACCVPEKKKDSDMPKNILPAQNVVEVQETQDAHKKVHEKNMPEYQAIPTKLGETDDVVAKAEQVLAKSDASPIDDSLSPERPKKSTRGRKATQTPEIESKDSTPPPGLNESSKKRILLLTNKARQSKRMPPEEMKELIVKMCEIASLTIDDMIFFLNRKFELIRYHYVRDLLERGIVKQGDGGVFYTVAK